MSSRIPRGRVVDVCDAVRLLTYALVDPISYIIFNSISTSCHSTPRTLLMTRYFFPTDTLGTEGGSSCASEDQTTSPSSSCATPNSASETPESEIAYTIGVTDGTPFLCKHCNKAFTRNSYCKKHEQVIVILCTLTPGVSNSFLPVFVVSVVILIILRYFSTPFFRTSPCDDDDRWSTGYVVVHTVQVLESNTLLRLTAVSLCRVLRRLKKRVLKHAFCTLAVRQFESNLKRITSAENLSSSRSSRRN